MQPTFLWFEPARLISRAAIVLFAVGSGSSVVAGIRTADRPGPLPPSGGYLVCVRLSI